MWHKPCRTFHPWCLCIKTRCLSAILRPLCLGLNVIMHSDILRCCCHMATPGAEGMKYALEILIALQCRHISVMVFPIANITEGMKYVLERHTALQWRHISVMAFPIAVNSSGCSQLVINGTSKLHITGPLWRESTWALVQYKDILPV